MSSVGTLNSPTDVEIFSLSIYWCFVVASLLFMNFCFCLHVCLTLCFWESVKGGYIYWVHTFVFVRHKDSAKYLQAASYACCLYKTPRFLYEKIFILCDLQLLLSAKTKNRWQNPIRNAQKQALRMIF